MQRLAISVLVALVVGGGVGYWLGAGVESGRAAQRELDQALAYADGWIKAADAARADATASAKAEVSRARQRDQAAAAVREVDRAIAALPARPECDWTADELRLARARHCARYPEDSACLLPAGLPGSAAAAEPATGMGAADGGLGIHMPQQTPDVRRLGAETD